MVHPKLTEILHTDFLNLAPVSDQLKDYNTCFFCLGVSSVGMKEEEYFRSTYALTMHVAEILSNQNKEMTFCYISGAGTDSSEKGRMSWARIKGKTENDLMKLPFKKVFAFRPGFMLPSKDAINVHGYYAVFRFFYPALRSLFPKYVSTLKEVGSAMINSVTKGYEKSVLEVRDIVELAKR